MIENKQVVTAEFSDHLKQPGQKGYLKMKSSISNWYS